MLLSVIIPFYRVEKYIGACLDALDGLEECEVLLVDDCGEDGSAELAQAYCTTHPFARVIRREKNGGLSAARNTGLSAAKGEYIYFLDSDDIPRAQALLHVAKQAKAQKLDIAKARFVYLDDETGALSDGTPIHAVEVMDGGALFAMQCAEETYEPMVWQCVYRRAFLSEIGLKMADGLLFEDELFQAPALLKAERAASFEDVILEYRQRQGSIMASFARSSSWCDSYLQVCRRLEGLAKTLEDGEPKRALRKRIGQIALSVGKNIPAYHLPPEIAKEAMNFLKENKRELVEYARKSGDAVLAMQGALMMLSPDAFVSSYGKAMRKEKA